MKKRVYPVVEGHGEVRAVPELIRRTLRDQHIFDWEIVKPYRCGDIATLQANGWKKFHRHLQAVLCEKTPILWMSDCDDDCVKTLLPKIYRQIEKAKIHQSISFCFWVREYETLFLHDPETIRKKYRLRRIDAPPEPPEKRRDAEGWIRKQLPPRTLYNKIDNQAALTAQLDLKTVRDRYRSFQHFEKALLWLIEQKEPALYPLKTD